MTITRTINTTRISANVFNVKTAEMESHMFTVSGKHTERDKEVEKTFKQWEKAYPDYKVLNILGVEIESGLYAMEEEIFLKYAERIGDGR